ncbi:endopeptidase La [Desulfoluna spongiiphila]|uniref:Lon protease n=1 Tax=Desulfoluna spongiiphila TaxID=419481 RepID=A0A1G5E7T5_9BACT|nr:endopeptidase La [Desulfoluna spongiiphila]SCY22558.1 ATP dependent PIM1 peptidase. Serine peptidase. MEROPS family S16 [Desulfoluna spongiiphila]VVS91619.1 lon protease bacterial/eukaryotic-type [Desulfoluna spongiiphila]
MENDEPITPEVVSENEADQTSSLAIPHQIMPDNLVILPVTGRPFLPFQAQPLIISQDKWQPTIEKAINESNGLVGLVLVRPEAGEVLGPDSFFRMGCVAQIHNVMADGEKLQVVAQGVRRFTIEDFLSKEAPFHVRVTYPVETRGDTEKLRGYSVAVIKGIREIIPLNPLYGEEVKNFVTRFSPNDASPLADFGASITTAPGKDIQDILETTSLMDRMKKVLVLLKKEHESLKLQSEISQEVNKSLNDNQRKFFLREQLKVIQKELGIAKDDRTADIDQFRERLEKLDPPEHVLERVESEIDKMQVLEKGSPEYAVSRNYLDWITSVPWGVSSEDKLDIKGARKILDRDHSGLMDVKDRIIEFLAVGVYKQEVSGSIMLLVGPPGVGKTSIGKSIAEALGRKFYRFSVGGMRDEAEIKGHRRTYIGALPGKFVQALKDTGVSNPVIMLDEIDKVGASYQGDPASALLEALDPEQNSEFLDHYFDLRLDLSKVLFICTANQLDTIPQPLLDRMDMTRLSGYITAEKVEIARKHLWPRLMERSGIPKKQLKITDAAIRTIADGYAREAGVRNLEKQMNRIVRKAVVSFLTTGDKPVSVGVKDIPEYLGPPIFRKERPMEGVGIVTGLAWTTMGGATLSVEATKIHDLAKGFKLTGQLGDVMKESAEIAYSFVSSHTRDFSVDKAYFDSAFVHLHVPEGATPKDGPSAGVTMSTALISLATGRKIDRPLAMTGEITLTGKVLPVGGIREKVIAARRIGIRELVLPDDNRRDVDELPDYISKGMTFHFAKVYKDVYKVVFGNSK